MKERLLNKAKRGHCLVRRPVYNIFISSWYLLVINYTQLQGEALDGQYLQGMQEYREKSSPKHDIQPDPRKFTFRI